MRLGDLRLSAFRSAAVVALWTALRRRSIAAILIGSVIGTNSNSCSVGPSIFFPVIFVMRRLTVSNRHLANRGPARAADLLSAIDCRKHAEAALHPLLLLLRLRQQGALHKNVILAGRRALPIKSHFPFHLWADYRIYGQVPIRQARSLIHTKRRCSSTSCAPGFCRAFRSSWPCQFLTGGYPRTSA